MSTTRFAGTTTQTGDTINAQASIVFDVNEPVITPPIFNTVDADLPPAAVNLCLPSLTALPSRSVGMVKMSREAQDFASYSSYVSEDLDRSRQLLPT
ncbi:MAG: hypothetical protein IPP40_07290 [bacterium]|nr:hypothetical protein [bacterium]